MSRPANLSNNTRSRPTLNPIQTKKSLPQEPKIRSTKSFNIPSIADYRDQKSSISPIRTSSNIRRSVTDKRMHFTPTFVEILSKKSNTGDGHFEDGRITRVEFEKLQIFDIATAVISMITISLTYDLEYENEDDERSNFLLWLLFVTGLTTMVLNTLRNLQYLEFLKARALLAREDTIFSSKLIYNLLIELSILILQPYPFFRGTLGFGVLMEGIRINMFDSYYRVDYYYHLNDLFSVLVVLRIYIVIRFILNSTRFRSTRAQRIAGFYGVDNDYLFVIKCLFKTAPITLCAIFFSLSIIVLGYALRICERTAAHGTDYNYYGNAFWIIILTMTTVGFGDYLPTTDAGRIIAFVTCLWGVSIVSIMILSVQITLNMTNSEKTSLLLLKKIEKRQLTKVEASTLIGNLAQLSMLKNKWFFSMEKKKKIVDYYKSRIKTQAKAFQVTNRALRNMQQDNMKEDMRRQFIFLQEDFQKLKSSQLNLQSYLESIMAHELNTL